MSSLKAKIDAAVLQHRKLWNVGPDEAKHLAKAMTDIARAASVETARRLTSSQGHINRVVGEVLGEEAGDHE